MLTYRRNEKDIHRRKDKGGFTLVELIVVLVILAMVAAGGAGGLITWQHNAQFRKANEYARTLFTAAQTYLNREKASGNLSGLTEVLAQGEKENASNGGKVPGKSNSGLSYLMWEPGNYSKLDDLTSSGSNDSTKDKLAKQFYRMFDAYLYDKSILNAYICVEMNAVDGKVRAVFYNDRQESLGYDGRVDINLNENGVRDQEEKRRSLLLGMYDVENLGAASPNSSEAPKITAADLLNGDTLDLCFRLRLPSDYNILDYTYEIQVLDVNGDPAASFYLNTDPSNYLKDYKTRHEELKIQTDVVLEKYKDDAGEPVIIKGCQMRAYVDEDLVYVTLDAVDLKAAKALDELQENNKKLPEGSKQKLSDNKVRENFNETYSILRFGDLYGVSDSGTDADKNDRKGFISVMVQAKGIKDSNKCRTSEESPLIRVPTDKSKYQVANARHFFNLRFLEEYFSEDGYSDPVEYSQTESFAWTGKDSLLSRGKMFQGCNAIEDNDEDGKDEKAVFPPFSDLAAGHSLMGKAGKTISGLYLTGKTTNVTYDAGNVKQKDGLALFLNNHGTIQNLTLEDHSVLGKWKENGTNIEKGINYVAGLCVSNSGTLVNIEIKSGEITGRNYVGGVVSYGPEKEESPAEEGNGTSGSGDESNLLSVESVSLAGATELVSIDTMRTEKKAAEAGKTVRWITTAEAQAASVDLAMAEGSSDAEPVTLKKLRNGAKVTGSSYVGGILPYMDQNVTLELCKNTGAVEGVPLNRFDDKASAPPALARYLGGIAGWNEGGKLNYCESAPGKTQGYTIETITSEMQKKEWNALLTGCFVGGIVGYSNGGSLFKCATTGGVLLGDRFVGGIIGYNGDSEVSGKQSINKADVIGKKYVGGILGANASPDGDTMQSSVPEVKGGSCSEDAPPSLGGCTNQGLVAAVDSYGGGITGYNTKVVQNCTSSVDISSADGKKLMKCLEEICGKGDYIGGIVGYNNGIIMHKGEGREKVVCVVAGRRYIGGIVGYNDAQGSLVNYELSSGYILGKSFTGGFAGVNTSMNMFHTAANGTSYALAKPILIEGKDFTGGLVGGSFLFLNDNATFESNTNNFLGRIDASEGLFVGGMVGYNWNLGSANGVFPSDRVREMTGKMAECVASSNEGLERDADGIDLATLARGLKNVEETYNDLISSSNYTLTITSKAADGASNSSETKLTEIKGYAYVGGVMGYNKEDSKVLLQSITNHIPVKATGWMRSESSATDELEESYAYVGGILGKVTKNVTIDDCKNGGAGKATADQPITYHGSLAEVNEGTIQNCTTANTESYSWSNVGGIAGKNSGRITKCKVAGTIFGVKNIGGIAAVNTSDGVISNTFFVKKSRITGSGENIGGIAGKNSGTITNKLDSGEPSITMENLQVDGTGTRVGGIAGTNYGTITNMVSHESVSVQGNHQVGGFIGYAAGGTKASDGSGNTAGVTSQASDGSGNTAGVTSELSASSESFSLAKDLINLGTVSARQGDAGGIIGAVAELDVTSVIEKCINKGTVEAQRQGDAGGIVSNVPSKLRLSECKNYALVKAGEKSVGGIAAINEGVIKDCQVSARNLEDVNQNEMPEKAKGLGKEKYLTLEARTDAGGIVSVNSGSIQNCQIYCLNVSNQKLSSKGSVGGAAGVNSGTIEGVTYSYGAVSNYANGTSTGGLVGKNETDAQVIGNVSGSSVRDVILSLNNNVNGNLGGICGWNQGIISAYKYEGSKSIVGNGGKEYGYGGIAGTNEQEIIDCTFSGSLSAKGDQSDLANVGGIAGVNRGQLKSCQIGVETATGPNNLTDRSITATYAYIGGAAGRNYGSISGITPVNSSKVSVITDYGNIGGLVGQNESDASLTDSETGKNWSVIATKTAADNAAGGAIGYNYSSKSLKKVTNNAAVTKDVNGSNSVGGLVGRWENSQEDIQVIDCKNTNTGTITGSGRLGGIIGQVKYSGVTLRGCINEGAIKESKPAYGGGAGGMIGYLYAVNDGKNINMLDCQNWGNITVKAQSAGGLLGSVQPLIEKTLVYYYENCLNAGDIESLNTQYFYGGISGAPAVKSAVFEYCRNYGTVNPEVYEQYSGISRYRSGSMTFRNCFGVNAPKNNRDVLYPPISNGGRCWKSYYFGDENEQQSDVNALEPLSVVYGSGNASAPVIRQGLDKLVDNKFGAESERLLIEAPSGTSISTYKPEITFDVENPLVNQIMISWFFNDSATRTYTYDLEYLSSGGDWKPVKDTLGTPYKGIKYNASVNNKSDTQRCDQTISVNLNDVQKLRLRVNSVLQGGQENRYLSIWEVQLNGSNNNEAKSKPLKKEEVTSDEKTTYTFKNSGLIIPGIPFDPNDPSSQKRSNEKGKEIDPCLQNRSLAGILPAPQNVRAELNFSYDETGVVRGDLEVSWDVTEEASTKVVLTIKGGNGVELSLIPENIEVQDKRMIAHITIPQEYINQGYEGILTLQNLPTENSSSKVASSVYTWFPDFNLDVDTNMPTPKFHLELDSMTSDLVNYTLVWDNKSEYEHLPRTGLTVKMAALSLENEMKDDRKPIPINNSSLGNNKIFTAYASRTTDEGTKQISKTLTYESQALKIEDLKNDKDSDPNDGDTNLLTLQSANFVGRSPESMYLDVKLWGKEQGMAMVELLAKDDEIDSDVVVASTSGRVVKDGTATFRLTDLPVKRQFSKVRAYMWRSQNEVIYYAVPKGTYSAEEVKELMINNPDQQFFVTEKGEDGYQVSSTCCKNQMCYAGGVNPWPQPVIRESYEKSGNTYRFFWDEGEGSGNEYEILLEGRTDSQAAWVTLDHQYGVSTYEEEAYDGAGAYYGEFTANNWRYQVLRLTVIRYGTEKADGSLTMLGSKSSQTFSAKIPITTLTAPVISLEGDNKNELEHKISWGGVLNEEKDALKKYEIWAKTETGETILLSTKDTLGTDNSAVVDFDSQGEDGRGSMGGQTLSIYVKAIAKEDHKVYTDSEDGLATSFQVPSRLSTPNVDQIELTMSDGSLLVNSPTVSKENFEKGFLLRLNEPDSSVNGVFQAYLTDLQSNTVDDNTFQWNKNITMEDNSYLIQGIPMAYAGYTLHVKVRATSYNSISSTWSEEKTFTLPKVYLETPELSSEDLSLESPKFITWLDDAISGETEITDSEEKKVFYKTLTWDAVPYAEGYEIEVMHLWEESKQEPDDRVPYKIFLYPSGNTENPWKLKVDFGGTGNFEPGPAQEYQNLLPDDTIKSDLNAEWAYSYVFGKPMGDSSDPSTPLYERSAMTGDAMKNNIKYYFAYDADLRLFVYEKDGKTSFRLVLPDSSARDCDFYRTQYVAVRALSGETSPQYATGKYQQWIQILHYELEIEKAGQKYRETDSTALDDGGSPIELESGWSIREFCKKILEQPKEADISCKMGDQPLSNEPDSMTAEAFKEQFFTIIGNPEEGSDMEIRWIVRDTDGNNIHDIGESFLLRKDAPIPGNLNENCMGMTLHVWARYMPDRDHTKYRISSRWTHVTFALPSLLTEDTVPLDTEQDLQEGELVDMIPTAAPDIFTGGGEETAAPETEEGGEPSGEEAELVDLIPETSHNLFLDGTPSAETGEVQAYEYE